MYFSYPPCFYPLAFFKTLDRYYTPLYEKSIKENQIKPMETTTWKNNPIFAAAAVGKDAPQFDSFYTVPLNLTLFGSIGWEPLA